MKTIWTDQADPAAPLPEYPRPQFVRENWTNLNGSWDYAIRPRDADRPDEWDGKILVPFAVESELSGVQKQVGPENRLWYRRTFTTQTLPNGERVILNFGAVDWQAEIHVNGQKLGVHEGGHDPFSFEITHLLVDGDVQELVVAVWDPTDAEAQPRGKQVRQPGAIWYTPVTGIWQTVWLESVPAASIHDLHLVPNFDRGSVRVSARVRGIAPGARLSVRVTANGKPVGEGEIVNFDAIGHFSQPVEIKIENPRSWSPDDPFLYDAELIYSCGQFEDRVKSYFGLRKVDVRRAPDGFDRIFLNNQPLFQYGPLDQGWWPDGLYTAPTDEALRWDVEITKRMGFNMTRKHVKVEPARWYYHCDRIGLLVWQDFPSAMRSGDPGHLPPRLQPLDGIFSAEDDAQFRQELAAMIESLRHFPSIVAWVPFNECWGQHATNDILAWVKSLDRTRLTNGPSGWNDLGFGDTIDQHAYPGPGMWPAQPGRASVLGEYGGLGAPIEGHLWQQEGNWSYQDSADAADLEIHYSSLVRQLVPLIRKGLAAAVYTQLTDVEGEVNGFITYDRKVTKISSERLSELHRPLIEMGAE